MTSKPIQRRLSAGLIEVLADNGSHYRAYILDLFDPKDPYVVNDRPLPDCPLDRPSAIVRFEGDWRPKEAIPLDRIRLPPIPPKPTERLPNGVVGDEISGQEIREGSPVEILCTGKEGEGASWCKSSVLMIKGEFFVVEDTSDSPKHKYNDQNCGEIVTKDRIRAINTNDYFKTNPFFKFMIEVPKEMLELNNQTITQNETHRHFRTALKLFAVNYDELTNRLICIGIAENRKAFWFERTTKWAAMLIDVHWKALRAELEIKDQIQSFKRKGSHFEEVIKSGENLYEVLVKVEEHLMGYAIGHKGANIDRALKVPGVKSVDRIPVDKNDNIFKVIGTNPKAIQLAKEIIQIIEEIVKVPRDIVSHVIGKHGQLVQEVTDKSGLIIINVKGDEPNKPFHEYVPFHLIGTREAIENSKILLDFHMSCVKENLEIDKQLAQKRNEIKRTSH